MGRRRQTAVRAFVVACAVVTVGTPHPAAAQTQDQCAALGALADERELAAAQRSYERMLLVDAPPACAGTGLAEVLVKRGNARRLLRDARAVESSDRRKALRLYGDALAIDAGLMEADDARVKPAKPADERTLHDVGNDVGGWATRRTSDLGNAVKAGGVVLGALVLALAVLAMVGAVVLRVGPVKRVVRRFAWNVRRVSLLTANPATRYGVGFLRWLMKPFAWATATPLQVEELKAPKAGAGAAVTQAIAGLLPTVTTRGTGGVAFVLAPFAAKTALEEVSDVLSSLPQGKVAAGVLKLARRVVPRDNLRLCGALLESPLRGPGLALSLVDVRGNVLEAIVLWASSFDPWHEPGAEKEPPGTRMLRLAWAAAIWSEFTALRHHGALGGEDDWRRHLGTRDWSSYALLRVNVNERGHRSALVTQATYAGALERDPHNVHALVNLANVDLELGDNRQAQNRFDAALEDLNAREKRRRLLRDPAQAKDRRLLTRDPVRYQAAYGQAVARLENGDADVKRLRTAADELKRYVLELECVLGRLDRKGGRDASELYALLRRLEGPLLVLWAYLDARAATADGDGAEPKRPDGPLPPAKPEKLDRRGVVAGLADGGQLGHDTLVRDFVLKHVEVGPKTQYDLSWYYTATNNYPEARRALQAALELGTLTDTAIADRQLQPLREADPRRFDKLVAVYRAAEATGLGAIAAIGPELSAKLVAVGLDSPANVIAAADTPTECGHLAARLDVGPSLIERWIRLLRMQQHVRLEVAHLNLLDAADVSSLGALGRVSAERLHELLKGAAGELDVPPEAVLQGWIERAQAA